MQTAVRRTAGQLFFCGACILFWELLLIRWAGSCIRVVAYYANFILISTFLGLGAGALLTRSRKHFWKYLAPLLSLSAVLYPCLGSFWQTNPTHTGEFVWIGTPQGLTSEPLLPINLPYWLVLEIVFLYNTALFMLFGQRLGDLFQRFSPLRAYTIEIGGSILGILLFTLLSWQQLSPPAWFLVGFILLVPVLAQSRQKLLLHAALAALTVGAIVPYTRQFIWSSYYKIQLAPLAGVKGVSGRLIYRFPQPIGMQVTVNNDYHQMILDLRARRDEHPFLRSWRWTYDYPYVDSSDIPDGPTLIVGAGTGNDVSAALRAGVSSIDAVEIDPAIVEIGRRYHPEQPYADARVRVVVDDARSFFAKTERRYARVVFGFLDSHTLMSSYSSLRLDNFVYTRESIERAKDLLLPGGKLYITFAANTPWIDRRIRTLLDQVFGGGTGSVTENQDGYSNGRIYFNSKPYEPRLTAHPSALPRVSIRVPTDDWPFLYMQDARLPAHYRIFMGMVIVLGLACLLLLPSGHRRIKLPYFFMGAGFFLIEASNVVSLSLLYGSTWIVNVTIFTGILLLILLGNFTCWMLRRPRYTFLFTPLFVSILIAHSIPPSAFLALDSKAAQGILAGIVFLGPVYLASLIFGQMIKQETDLNQAYGSNLLGAVVGGSCEYFSIVYGLKQLLVLTFVFYVLAFVYGVGVFKRND